MPTIKLVNVWCRNTFEYLPWNSFPFAQWGGRIYLWISGLRVIRRRSSSHINIWNSKLKVVRSSRVFHFWLVNVSLLSFWLVVASNSFILHLDVANLYSITSQYCGWILEIFSSMFDFVLPLPILQMVKHSGKIPMLPFFLVGCQANNVCNNNQGIFSTCISYVDPTL